MAQVTDIESGFFMLWFDNDAKTRGTQFEHLMCYWLLTDPVRKAEYDLVTVVRYEDWSERSGPDLGVDLVCTDSQGRLWAVQCKAYALDTTISKDEVSTLVGASPADKFFGRIYITTSNGFTENAKSIAKDNSVLRISRSTLDSSTVVWPESEKDLHLLLNGPAVPPTKLSPRPHQRPAIAAVVDAFKSQDRAKLLMACGTGKTLTSLWIQEQVLGLDTAHKGPRRTVVLFPSISLLSQTLHEWTSQRSHTWRRLAVCSDQSVMSSRKNEHGEYSDVSVGDLDFSVTTDQSVIEEFLSSDDDQVIFSTYQSSKQVGQAALNCGIEFDLVVCDEAHHLTGSLDKTNSSVLTDEKFPTKKRLFMTATPRIITPLAARNATDAGYKVSSMDDEKLFGVVAYELNFGQAIAEGVLTDYQVVIAVASEQAAKDLYVNKFVDINKTKTTTHDLASTIASAKALEKYGVSKSISFHSTIRRSKSFVHIMKTLSGEGIDGVPPGVHADHVDGTMSSSERLKKLTTLKSGSSSYSLLANARCLSEGVDVPALDGVIFVDPRQSEIDIVQAVGRAIRKSDTKRVGTVVIPVVCSLGADGAVQLDAKGHKKLRQVLWSLRAHDAALGVEIDELVFSQKLSNHGVVRLPSKIIIEIDEEYTGEELRKFASGISVTVLKAGSPDADWEERYKEVVEYYVKNNAWPSGKDSDLAVKPLGVWVGTQRDQGKKLASGVKSKMAQERYDRLDETPGWLWDSLSDAWEGNFASCLEYYVKNNSWPSTTDADAVVKRLGVWAGSQRDQGKKLASGVKSTMTQERYDKLDKTPGWLWNPFSDVWESNFASCLEYYVKNNAWPSGVDSDAVVKRLGAWVGAQRDQGKKLASGVKSKMAQERYDRLDETPGWLWDSLSDAWEGNFASCLEYYVKNNSWPSTTDADAVVKRLGVWAGSQRDQGKKLASGVKSTMTQERYDKLDKTPGWLWNPFSDVWESNFAGCLEYYRKNKSWPSRKDSDAEVRSLGPWVFGQRTQGKKLASGGKSQMTQERYDKLDKAPGWVWDKKADVWESNFASYLEYYAKNNTWPRPTDSDAEVNYLSNWVASQRVQGSKLAAGVKSEMTQERYDKLDKTPGWLWYPSSHIWESNFADCLEYYGKNSSWPSRDDSDPAVKRLGKWVSHQRTGGKKLTSGVDGSMTQERYDRLDKTPGWLWDASALKK